ncbi:hypothetical protein Kisp02_54080 [Kineosporia sp. NBRC 101731]|nr:hypothetical protein Kisp02_54080 [Kineosporia sp. NBRC 101731]
MSQADDLVARFRKCELSAEQLVAEIAALTRPVVAVKPEAVKQAERALWRLRRHLER